MTTPLIMDLAALRMTDVASVGGKNASLGEMISQLGGAGVRVPGGFATTSHAYREFLAQGGLKDRIATRLHSSRNSDHPLARFYANRAIERLVDAGEEAALESAMSQLGAE